MRHINKLLPLPITSRVLTAIGALIYTLQTIYFTFTQKSMIDEGLFLYKGYLFASGTYTPFQDFGPWMQKAPFAYLIPGYIQLWFGPGLGVGRLFAVLISLLILVGIWLVAKRLGGLRWAAVAVFAVALNPALIKYYSISNSQGLVACLLVWILFLSLGGNRPTWQLLLSAFLGSILVFTRQNMLPVLPLLLLYIAWQYGRKPALLGLGISAAVFLAVDLLYWPGILRMWAPFLPASLTPFLDAWRAPHGDSIFWMAGAHPPLLTQLASFFMGIRYHFSELIGGGIAILLWPRRSAWKSPERYKAAVFLLVLFIVLTGIHLWAGTGNSEASVYNAWSFSEYMAFFSWLGLFLVIITIPYWKEKIPLWRNILAGILVILVTTGIGYSSYGTYGYSILQLRIPKIIEYFRSGNLLGGAPTVAEILGNKYGLVYEQARIIAPTIFGFMAGVAFLAACVIIWLVFRQQKRQGAFFPLGSFLMIIFLVLGAILSPTRVFGGDFKEYDCGTNVISNFRQVGRSLAEVIPSGSTIYWDGGNAISEFLYIPNNHIFPQQLDENWSYWTGGDSDLLARYGFWNENLKRQWQQDANIFIIQQSQFTDEWQSFLDPGNFEELTISQLPLGCTPDSYLRVFQKK